MGKVAHEQRAIELTGLQIGPSLTPLTGLNSGFRVYEVDTGVSVMFSCDVDASLMSIAVLRHFGCPYVRLPSCTWRTVDTDLILAGLRTSASTRRWTTSSRWDRRTRTNTRRATLSERRSAGGDRMTRSTRRGGTVSPRVRLRRDARCSFADDFVCSDGSGPGARAAVHDVSGQGHRARSALHDPGLCGSEDLLHAQRVGEHR